MITSEKDIIKAQGRTIRLQEDAYNEMTGGNSVAFLQLRITGTYFSVSSNPRDPRILQLILFNSGKYPIQNVSVDYYTAEEKRQITEDFPADHENQKPIARILVGDPPAQVLLQNLHLFPYETKPIENFKLDYDTMLISIKWIVNVFWKDINYKYKFKIVPPAGLIRRDWTIEDLSISIDGKKLTEDLLIPYIRKKLEVYKH